MNATPSKREVQHYLKNFGTKPTVHNSSSFQTEYLPQGSFNQIALIKVEGDFDNENWASIGKTIYNLQKLGLTSVVVIDNKSSPHDHTASVIKNMMKESNLLVDAIENAGGRAKLIYGGNALETLSVTKPIHVNVNLIQSTLNHNQIPVIAPISMDTGGVYHPIQANKTTEMILKGLIDQGNPVLIPAKMIVINKEGGIPNHQLPGSTHSLINLQEEFKDISDALTNRGHLEDLQMIQKSLSLLPITSSAVIVPASSLPSTLITNLITDKPLYSSSLPIHDFSRVNQTKTTVLRKGTKLKDYHCLADVDLDRLTELLENSFQKRLDVQHYYKRLDAIMETVIVAGDYEGAVICTNEQVASKKHVYLDKFAIAPKSQGIGLNDILWKRLCFHHPEFMWRSKMLNGVNKW
jgi:amino-acid N-acetyltransferase